METLITAILLGLLCCGWGLLQRWVARCEPDLDKPHCGCHGRELHAIETADAERCEQRGGVSSPT
jgi:hypothetical protein